MTKVLLSAHVLGAILAVGSIAVAASLFPRYAKQAVTDEDEAGGRAAGIAQLLHRVCRGYAVVGLAVPVFGLATGAKLGVLTDAWLIASMILTAIAALMLAVVILPDQQRLLAMPRQGTEAAGLSVAASRLTMVTGIFNLLWSVVVVLMIVRPGSTTGA
ncbi:hypothetical protein ACFFS2_09740 [Streptomyces aurantiacus]|uniref:Hypothetical conserved integral membrane protein n=1 Tax=Streptomyces aurantiacus TaxID=47760 RepID=A0A7G1NQ21_9ACTN|nr:hypothetical protein [Streptomyces aurantiacus]BCL25333.1 hypothetical conserved integral membrane protein [Streptomyces aurantiacus]